MSAQEPWTDPRERAFLDYPIARLEEWGVNPVTVSALQREYGLFLRGLQAVKAEELLKVTGIGPKTMGQVVEALHRVWVYLEGGKDDGSG